MAEQREVVSLTFGGDVENVINELKKIKKKAEDEGRAMSKSLDRAFADVEKQAERAGRTVGDRLKAGFDRAKSAGTAAINVTSKLSAVALAAGAAFAAMAENVAGTVDEVGTFAAMTGFTADTINGLRRQAAVTNKALSDIVPKDLPKRIAETAQGTGEALRGFAALEIEVTDAAGALRSTDEILVETLDKLAQVENPTTKAALAVQILGAEGQQMLSAFEDSAGLENAIEEARQFGIKVGPDAVAASNAWFDATADLNIAWETAQQRLFEAFGPASVKFINDFTLGFVFLQSAAGGLLDALSGDGSFETILEDATREAALFWRTMQDGATVANDVVGPTLDMLNGKFDDQRVLANVAALTMKTEVPEGAKAANDALLELVTGNETLDRVGDAAQAAADAIGEDMVEAAERAEDAMIAMQERMRDTIAVVADSASSLANTLVGFSQLALDRFVTQRQAALDTARELGVFTEEELRRADELSREQALKGFKRTQALQISAAVIEAARAAISMIPGFAFLGPAAPVAAAAAAGGALALQIAQIRSQQPPSFPTGGVVPPSGSTSTTLDAQDHRLVSATPGEGIASLRAMGDPGFAAALHAANRGEIASMAGQEVHVRVSYDGAASRLRVTASKRLPGKRDFRRT